MAQTARFRSRGTDGTVIGGLVADIITVLMGYNDAAAGLTAAQYRTNLGALVDRIRGQDPTNRLSYLSVTSTTHSAQGTNVFYRVKVRIR